MYRERLPKTWTLVCVGVYLALVVKLGIDAVPEDTGLWLIVSASFLLVLLPCVAVPISKAVYHRIAIDPARGVLRVGRERLALADLDPRLRPRRTRRARTCHGGPPRDVRSDHRRARPRPAGGGPGRAPPRRRRLGRPPGHGRRRIATRGGEALSIATHDRRAFLTALAATLPARR